MLLSAILVGYTPAVKGLTLKLSIKGSLKGRSLFKSNPSLSPLKERGIKGGEVDKS